MGYSTTFLGRLDIEPRLNTAEVEWLTAYAELDRRYFTDPYEVPMNPRAYRIQRDAERMQAPSKTKGGRSVKDPHVARPS